MKEKAIYSAVSIVSANIIFICSLVLVSYWMLMGHFALGLIIFFAVGRGLANWMLYTSAGPTQVEALVNNTREAIATLKARWHAWRSHATEVATAAAVEGSDDSAEAAAPAATDGQDDASSDAETTRTTDSEGSADDSEATTPTAAEGDQDEAATSDKPSLSIKLFGNTVAMLTGLSVGAWTLNSYMNLIHHGTIAMPYWVAFVFSVAYVAGIFMISRGPLVSLTTKLIKAFNTKVDKAGFRKLLKTPRFWVQAFLIVFSSIGSALIIVSKSKSFFSLMHHFMGVPASTAAPLGLALAIVGFVGLKFFTVKKTLHMGEVLTTHPRGSKLHNAFKASFWPTLGLSAVALAVFVGNGASNVGIILGAQGGVGVLSMALVLTIVSGVCFGAQATMASCYGMFVGRGITKVLPADPTARRQALILSTVTMLLMGSTYMGWLQATGHLQLFNLTSISTAYGFWGVLGLMSSVVATALFQRFLPDTVDNKSLELQKVHGDATGSLGVSTPASQPPVAFEARAADDHVAAATSAPGAGAALACAVESSA